MTLASLTLRRIAIPFRDAFRHAAAERNTTEGVWIEACSRRGAVGYGEGCPRRYVTSEDLPSVKRFFTRHRRELLARIADVGDVVAWSEEHRTEIDQNPAAWCALELALLDVLAKERDESVEATLGLCEAQGTFRYSAVVGVSDRQVFRKTVERYRAFGFDDFKLKLSGRLDQDRDHLAWFRHHVPEPVRLRLDANNLWATADEAARYLAAIECPFFGIEEPLRAERYAELAMLAAATGTRIILDESCVRAQQLREVDGLGDRWIVNVRVSKMGGILRSLRVVDAARMRGIPIVVGAHVGETSVLTRAALTVASQARDLLIAQEGAFGVRLLTADVCDPALMFGPGGRLASTSSPGFGLAVRADLLFTKAL